VRSVIDFIGKKPDGLAPRRVKENQTDLVDVLEKMKTIVVVKG
jgi:hypothetical protein